LLQARPQLGHEVFARSRPGPDSQVASYLALMEACLTVLRGRDDVRAARADAGRDLDTMILQTQLASLDPEWNRLAAIGSTAAGKVVRTVDGMPTGSTLLSACCHPASLLPSNLSLLTVVQAGTTPMRRVGKGPIPTGYRQERCRASPFRKLDSILS
jgi:hypothetical protein